MTYRNCVRLREYKRKTGAPEPLDFDEVCAVVDAWLAKAHEEWLAHGDDDQFYAEVASQCEVLKDAAQDAIAARMTARSVQA